MELISQNRLLHQLTSKLASIQELSTYLFIHLILSTMYNFLKEYFTFEQREVTSQMLTSSASFSR